ncbi:MAG TPA: NADH-quinone oxidoreductase subunit L [Dehalococcoidia bacterium]|nr:NADH-quinone oxidoreductase subunit L [Dehalococcoidia bacterium]
MGTVITFWALAVASVVAALAVVFLRDVFRAALFLLASFIAVAGIFLLLSADFLAAIQVLIYVGAIGVLIVFAIMLTREVKRGNPWGRMRFLAAIAGALLLVTIVLAVVNTAGWPGGTPPPPQATTEPLAMRLFDLETGFVLPFEIASVLLLAAVIGAIVLVRER